MKQIVQDLKNGRTNLVDVPAPALQPGQILVRNHCSLVSAGTERMLLDFGKAGWLQKARQQPERVKQVLEKARKDGWKPTLAAVRSKLAQPLPLGYSSAGIVIGTGAGVRGFAVGDRVATNGHHAEVVSVPQHLAARIPDGVEDEAAAFTVLGAIALQGIRLAAPTFGETVLVSGLGLIGQLCAQLQRTADCRVIGLDPDGEKRALLEAQGMEALDAGDDSVVEQLTGKTGGIGVDAVIITASTASSEPVSTAARASRKRGRIVLVGVTGLQLSRSEFYEKELSFQVSCSYGPGRYDPAYEQGGQDYPIGFVRWTEQRNFEAVLAAMAAGQLRPALLLSAKMPLQDYRQIYDDLGRSGIASLLVYPETAAASTTVHYNSNTATAGGTANIGMIGAGGFTQSVLLPLLRELKAVPSVIASAKGLSAGLCAQRFGIGAATTDVSSVLHDASINLVCITTRHKEHALLAVEALKAGKHVFVEKPLALLEDELAAVIEAYHSSPDRLLSVGFNRRFAPLSRKLVSLLPPSAPRQIVITVNAGSLPQTHWTRDPETGGGRLLGEGCHFIDLAAYFSGSLITAVFAASPDDPADPQDFTVSLQMANGSGASINYLSGGAGMYPKERAEVHCAGSSLVIDNWRKLTGYGLSGFSSQSGSQNKGHREQLEALLRAVREGGMAPVAFADIVNSSRATLAAAESLRSRQAIQLPVS